MIRATWWTQLGKGVQYVRADLPARFLPGKMQALDYDVVTEDGEFPDGSPRLKFHGQEGDASIWFYPGNKTRSMLMERMQANGVKVLAEMDDNYSVRAPRQHDDWYDTIREGYDTDEHSREGHVKIVASPIVDGIIVSTPYLERVYRKLKDKVYVCPNCVDPDDWVEVAGDLPKDDVLRIGYAGSNSHMDDTKLIERACRWAAKQDGVELVFFGVQPPEMEDLAATRIVFVEPKDYRKLLPVLDVGFAPLIPNVWSLARSDVKLLEYGMAGALPIVSRTRADNLEPYHQWFQDAPNLVADSARDFYDRVRWCVKNRDEVKRLGAEMRETVIARRHIKDHVDRWEFAISDC